MDEPMRRSNPHRPRPPRNHAKTYRSIGRNHRSFRLGYAIARRGYDLIVARFSPDGSSTHPVGVRSISPSIDRPLTFDGYWYAQRTPRPSPPPSRSGWAARGATSALPTVPLSRPKSWLSWKAPRPHASHYVRLEDPTWRWGAPDRVDLSLSPPSPNRPRPSHEWASMRPRKTVQEILTSCECV